MNSTPPTPGIVRASAVVAQCALTLVTAMNITAIAFSQHHLLGFVCLVVMVAVTVSVTEASLQRRHPRAARQWHRCARSMLRHLRSS